MQSLRDTIEQLQHVEKVLEAEGIDGRDIAVRLATQPSWPFEYDIDSISDAVNIAEEGKEKKYVVYLAEGYQIGYLPELGKEAFGW